jgi:DNA-binding transcriptional LysR family regulator
MWMAHNRGSMRCHKLDLNLLTALRALLSEKNVTRAGEAVHVTQSAMSGILARLRDYFGDPLIVIGAARVQHSAPGGIIAMAQIPRS